MKHYKPSGGKTKKRLLALVLAAALVCSSLMPVYANDVALMDDDFSVMAMDEMPAAVTMDDSLDLAPGINESVDEFGNVVITWGSDTWTDWTQASDDQLIASPYPDGEQMDPGFAIPTVTYRFWLSQKDKTELAAFNAEVESGVKLYGMTKAEYIDLYGPNDGMFSAIHVADGGSLWDNSFKNPTASDAPDAGKTVFAGWYTLDEHGYEQKFTFDADCKEDHVSNGVVYASEMATVDVFAKWSTAVTDQAEQPKTNPDYDDTLDDHTYDKWYAALVSSSDSAFQGLLEQYTADEGFCDWLDEMPEDEIKYLTERMDATAETIPEGKTGTHNLSVGDTMTLTGSTSNSWGTRTTHSWLVDESSIVSITSGTTNANATIKANAKGTAVVTHTLETYTYSLNGTTTTTTTDTFTINVSASGSSSSGYAFSITHEITDAEVAWVYYKVGMTTDNIVFHPVEPGETVTYRADKGVLLFFVKPKENHLLTVVKHKTIQNIDLYATTVAARDSLLQYFINNKSDNANAQTLLDLAKDDDHGYKVYFGFTFDTATKDTPGTFIETAVEPTMELTATAEPSSNVKEDETITFTVRLSPQEKIGDSESKIESVTVTELTINEKTYENFEAVKQSDGTYTVQIPYTATEEDVKTGGITLDVSAEIKYSYKLPLKDRANVQSQADTEATVKKSGQVTVSLAEKKGVYYKLTYVKPDGMEIPDTIPTAPVDKNTYYVDDEVNVKSYDRNDVVVSGGTWSFSGWKYGDKSDYNEGETIKMPESGITLEGIWIFTPNPNTTVTIEKKVTGFFGERNKDFQFTISFAEGTDTNNITAKKGETPLDSWNTFTLKNGESVVLSGVPIGAQITVTETNADDYDVSAKVGNEPLTKVEGSNAFTYTTVNANNNADLNKIVVTNHKTADVDAGVDLGSATPYLFLLCVGAVGAATLRRKRRS